MISFGPKFRVSENEAEPLLPSLRTTSSSELRIICACSKPAPEEPGFAGKISNSCSAGPVLVDAEVSLVMFAGFEKTTTRPLADQQTAMNFWFSTTASPRNEYSRP